MTTGAQEIFAFATSVSMPRSPAGLVLRTSALLLVTGGAAALLTRGSAALRHFLWSLALAGALALPLLSSALPWSWEVLPAASRPKTAARAGDASAVEVGTRSRTGSRSGALSILPAGAPDHAKRTTSSARPAGARPSTLPSPVLPSAAGAAAILWAGVAALLLMNALVGRLLLAWMARRAAPVTDAAVLAEISRASRGSGMRRRVRVLRSDAARIPMTWGVRRPVVILPATSEAWSTERLRLVLRHELAHVRRLDDLTHSLARIACAVHWFNPLVWWAAARLRDESEQASDDLVLSGGARASEYAGHLLDLVSALGSTSAPAGALPLAQRSRFEGRLLAILDPTRDRAGVRAGGALALVASAAALVTLLGVVAPARAAEPEAATTPTARSTAADSTSVNALIRALSGDSDDGVRKAAAWALGQLENRAATSALAAALRGDDAIEVRRTAAWALGQIEDASAVPALADALDDTDAEVSRTALWALGQIESPEAVGPLTRVLKSPDPERRKTAAWALGQIESRDAVGPLLAVVADSDENVREQAIWALGQIESDDAVPTLTRALTDDAAKVRRQAAWALGQIESDAALDGLAAALSDQDAEVAATAAWAIGQIEPSKAPPALLEAVRSGTGKVRSNALWALSQIEDPAAVPALTEALHDENPEVRAMALRGLAEIRDESAIRAITELMDDPNPEVRAAAVRALAGRGGWSGNPRPRPQPRPRPRPNGG